MGCSQLPAVFQFPSSSTGTCRSGPVSWNRTRGSAQSGASQADQLMPLLGQRLSPVHPQTTDSPKHLDGRPFDHWTLSPRNLYYTTSHTLNIWERSHSKRSKMFAAHQDQENRIAQQAGNVKQLPAKAPGALYPKTPLKVPLKDENTTRVFGGKGTIAKGNNGFTKANMITPGECPF